MMQCFALSQRGKCTILKVMKCEGESCKFKKTKEQLEKEQEWVKERLKGLGLLHKYDAVR